MTDAGVADASTTDGVRLACAEDMPAVAALRWQWMSERHDLPPMPREQFVNQFAAWARGNSATHRCLVAVRSGEIIGMAWLATLPRVPTPLAMERTGGDVQCVYVTPPAREGGVGRELVDAVLRLARELGLERVTVHASQRAIPVYTRAGFVSKPQLLQIDTRG